jgi:flagellar secretion chaperone FliS
MNRSASDNYLVTEVMTATPQKLQLMLLDAAIREGQRAKMHWQAKDEKEAGNCILHAQRIVMGILGGIDYETNLDLVKKVAGVYLFICQTLTRAYLDNDETKLDDALRVLAIERKTWKLLCDKIADSSDSQSGNAPITPNLFSNEDSANNPPVSFSLEA